MAMVKTSMRHMELEDTTELEDTKLEDTYDMGLVYGAGDYGGYQKVAIELVIMEDMDLVPILASLARQ